MGGFGWHWLSLGLGYRTWAFLWHESSRLVPPLFESKSFVCTNELQTSSWLRILPFSWKKCFLGGSPVFFSAEFQVSVVGDQHQSSLSYISISEVKREVFPKT